MTTPTTIPAHPPPPSEPATTINPEQLQPPPPPPPPPPPSRVESEAPPKRRKLEEVGFQHSPYYTIRETVVNLRGRFLQVSQGTDSQQKDAAVEILKEMKDAMELSKKTRLDLSSTAEPVEPFEKPEAKTPQDIPAGNFPSTEKSQVPPTSLAGNFVHSTGGDIPIRPANSDTAAHRLLVETKREPDQVRQQIIQSSRVDSRKGLMSSVDLPLAGIFLCGLDAKQSSMV